MIHITRAAEPEALTQQRQWRLARLMLAWEEANPRTFKEAAAFVEAHSGELTSYDAEGVRVALREMQSRKCPWCERSDIPKSSPIDHVRPRRPDGNQHSGYWWLTWSWENLLHTCSDCNLSKSNTFPASGARLTPFETPPEEGAMLVDPTAECPRQHIKFAYDSQLRRWVAQGLTQTGNETIKTLKFQQHLSESHEVHLEMLRESVIRPISKAPLDTLRSVWDPAIRRVFRPTRPFHALSYDVLDDRFPRKWRDQHGLNLPEVARTVEFRPWRPLIETPSSLESLSERSKMWVLGLSRSPDVARQRELLRHLIQEKAPESWSVAGLRKLLIDTTFTPQTLATRLSELAQEGHIEDGDWLQEETVVRLTPSE